MAKNLKINADEIRKKIPKDNVSLETLGLINQGLFTVDKELAQRYNTILKNVFNLDCDVDSFRIDKRGLSPELCAYFKKKYSKRFEFGDSYLNIKSANRFMIVISPDQQLAPLVAPQTSYEDGLFDEVYRQSRHTIEDITQSEALFGELENGIAIYNSADDLLSFRTVEISLDTLEGTVKNFFELRKMSDNLGDDDNALNPDYIQKMQEYVKSLGDIRNRSISKVFPITKEVHCFYVEFFKGIHCLRNFNKQKGNLKTIFISHEQGDPKDFGEEILSLDLHDPKVLDVLHSYKFLKYNENLIPQRLREIEDETLLSEGIDIVNLEPYQRKGSIVQCYSQNKFPEVYDELKEISKLTINKSIKNAIINASYEARLKLSEPPSKKEESVSKPELINHMLAELDHTDPVRIYEFNKRKLITEFPSLPTNRQRYIAYALLNHTGGNK
ncbi:MAG: hypothetical protein PHH54_01620 [Candidatus Nanoarchaeia archaeon]|nr:hypothetical protein [Candidatus Nanoarchaeia archaeon]MDD5740661.1 hypothetical protein [Candidatus Nanoarchaeia archaeon]